MTPIGMTFPAITQAIFDALKARATAAGIRFTPDGTQATFMGCTFVVHYLPPQRLLTITCMDKPWYISGSTVVNKIGGLVDEAKGATTT